MKRKVKFEKDAPLTKLNRVRMAFYRECIKENLTENDISALGYCIGELDSPKDVMAGIKAGKQRKLNADARKRKFSLIAKKAWATRNAKAKANA